MWKHHNRQLSDDQKFSTLTNITFQLANSWSCTQSLPFFSSKADVVEGWSWDMVLSLRVVSVGQLMLLTSFYTLNLLEYNESRVDSRLPDCRIEWVKKKRKNNPLRFVLNSRVWTSLCCCEKKVGWSPDPWGLWVLSQQIDPRSQRRCAFYTWNFKFQMRGMEMFPSLFHHVPCCSKRASSAVIITSSWRWES